MVSVVAALVLYLVWMAIVVNQIIPYEYSQQNQSSGGAEFYEQTYHKYTRPYMAILNVIQFLICIWCLWVGYQMWTRQGLNNEVRTRILKRQVLFVVIRISITALYMRGTINILIGDNEYKLNTTSKVI